MKLYELYYCLNVQVLYLLLFIFVGGEVFASLPVLFLCCYFSQNFSYVFVGSRQIFVNMVLFLYDYLVILRWI